jgi:hypothetical protein
MYQVSIVTLAGSKKDNPKFDYREKPENLHSCSLICWICIMEKAKEPYVKNVLIQATGQGEGAYS